MGVYIFLTSNIRQKEKQKKLNDFNILPTIDSENYLIIIIFYFCI